MTYVFPFWRRDTLRLGVPVSVKVPTVVIDVETSDLVPTECLLPSDKRREVKVLRDTKRGDPSHPVRIRDLSLLFYSDLRTLSGTPVGLLPEDKRKINRVSL